MVPPRVPAGGQAERAEICRLRLNSVTTARRSPFGKRLEGALEPFKPWIMEGNGYKGG